MKRVLLCLFALSGIMGGCAHVMSEAALRSADRSVTYTDIKKNPEALAGRIILIGGIIAETRSNGDVMQLEIAQLELMENGVPDELSASAGRFLIVSGELLDPLFYRPGMLATVIGEIKGQKIQKLEGTDYRYPIVSAREIRLFRASESFPNHRDNPYQNLIGDGRFMLRPPGGIEAETRGP